MTDPEGADERLVMALRRVGAELVVLSGYLRKLGPKTLAAYRLGMKAKGSIAGVVIDLAPNCCDAARCLPADKVYHPNEAPHLPLPDCPQGRHCGCVYRPVMTYPLIDKR